MARCPGFLPFDSFLKWNHLFRDSDVGVVRTTILALLCNVVVNAFAGLIDTNQGNAIAATANFNNRITMSCAAGCEVIGTTGAGLKSTVSDGAPMIGFEGAETSSADDDSVRRERAACSII